LGLFLVYSIARRHGGRAYAESAGTGAGSTFTLELPAAPALAADAQLARSAT
jgi:signal transduction histidine kinase